MILVADVVGFSRLMGVDEEATLATLNSYREIMVGLIAAHDGRVVSTTGDGLLAEFPSAVEAMRSAVEIQENIKTRNRELPDDRKMRLRIGVNLGDVMVEGDDLYGDGVNVAARLETIADPGGICVAGTVYDQVKNKLDLEYKNLGEQKVKNIADAVRAYAVLLGPPEAVSAGIDSGPPPLPRRPSIAVLPFANFSGDPEQEYFSDGITEDIITGLSKISGLLVVARNSSFVYKGKAENVQQVGQDLGVKHVLEGSVRKVGERVRITAQLVDAETGYHLWAERYDRELTDIFELQDEITGNIVAALEVKLTAGEHEQVTHRYTENMEAYDLFLQARECRLIHTREAMAQARAMFEQAIAHDPDFAGAYAELSHLYLINWHHQWSDAPKDLDHAYELVKKAVALDESLPEAHTYLGWIDVWRGRHAEAVTEAKRAIEIDPNFAEGYARLAEILTFAGKPEEGIELMKKAMRLNPHYFGWYLFALGHAYYLAGEPGEATATLRRAVVRSPNFLPAHLILAAVHGEAGEIEEARAAVAEILRISPRYCLELGTRRPYSDEAVLERLIDALGKAGLPGI